MPCSAGCPRRRFSPSRSGENQRHTSSLARHYYSSAEGFGRKVGGCAAIIVFVRSPGPDLPVYISNPIVRSVLRTISRCDRTAPASKTPNSYPHIELAIFWWLVGFRSCCTIALRSRGTRLNQARYVYLCAHHLLVFPHMSSE